MFPVPADLAWIIIGIFILGNSAFLASLHPLPKPKLGFLEDFLGLRTTCYHRLSEHDEHWYGQVLILAHISSMLTFLVSTGFVFLDDLPVYELVPNLLGFVASIPTALAYLNKYC